jgi:hypothetical protein
MEERADEDRRRPERGRPFFQVVIDIEIGEEEKVGERGEREEGSAERDDLDDEARRDRENLASPDRPPMREPRRRSPRLLPVAPRAIPMRQAWPSPRTAMRKAAAEMKVAIPIGLKAKTRIS